MAFQPGESGNPGGRRKDKIATRELILALNEQDGDVNKLRRVIDAVIAKACDGDVAAINAVFDRVEGKVPQAVGGGEDGTSDIVIRVNVGGDAPTDRPCLTENRLPNFVDAVASAADNS